MQTRLPVTSVHLYFGPSPGTSRCNPGTISNPAISGLRNANSWNVYWPNGCMDQDETWHGGRPRPWPHCFRWGPNSPPPKGHSPRSIFGPCPLWPLATWLDGQMPLGTEVGLGPKQNIVLVWLHQYVHATYLRSIDVKIVFFKSRQVFFYFLEVFVFTFLVWKMVYTLGLL